MTLGKLPFHRCSFPTSKISFGLLTYPTLHGPSFSGSFNVHDDVHDSHAGVVLWAFFYQNS